MGLASFLLTPPASITTAELLALVDDLNRKNDVDGILVQMPLPSQVDAKRILDAVTPEAWTAFIHGQRGATGGRTPAPRWPAPLGVMEIFRRSGINLEGANAVVMGRSDIVGKPMALLMIHANATVTVCHSKTRDLKDVVRRADIVVVAMGRAAMVAAEYRSPRGATSLTSAKT